MKVAVVQLNAGADKQKNLFRAEQLVKQSARRGAKWILLPEAFNFRGDLKRRGNLSSVPERIPGESSRHFMSVAKRYKVFILLGSICERSDHKTKVYNTSVLIDPRGKIQAKYRKINLFDAVLGKKKLRESQRILPGRKLARAKINQYNVGLSICYDLRFPQLYQNYSSKGVNVLCVPSAFTYKTGQAHWETLLRARAIENLAYVLAPNQTGKDHRGVACYGNSMIISPWGEILARAPSRGERVLTATLDLKAIEQARKILPSIKKR